MTGIAILTDSQLVNSMHCFQVWRTWSTQYALHVQFFGSHTVLFGNNCDGCFNKL